MGCAYTPSNKTSVSETIIYAKEKGCLAAKGLTVAQYGMPGFCDYIVGVYRTETVGTKSRVPSTLSLSQGPTGFVCLGTIYYIENKTQKWEHFSNNCAKRRGDCQRVHANKKEKLRELYRKPVIINPELGMPSYSKYLAYFKRVVTTPKADRLLFEENTYTFDVDMRLSKPMIKRLFEDIFKVEVTRVNTYNRHKPDKQGKSFYDIWLKRAYITVAEGQYPFQKLSNSDAQLAPIGVEDDE